MPRRYANHAFSNRAGVNWVNEDALCRGTWEVHDGSMDLFWLAHPSSSEWYASQRALVRSLLDKPLNG